MSKRKRLVPPGADLSGPLETKAFVNGWQGVRAPAPPIAGIAADASAVAALEELSDEMAAARTGGRMVISVPLASVVADHLVRDRTDMDPETFESLRESLRARGQQNPIEVVALEGDRYGLISGWRRLCALQSLLEETSDQSLYGHIQCLIRRPDADADAYIAMVEENEIRADLSFYERARIAARATEQGAFSSLKAALNGLYGAVSRARRSKIKSFVPLYEHLDDVLRFPAAIPERLGLALSAALEARADFAPALRQALAEATPADAAAERVVLEAALRSPDKAKTARSEASPETASETSVPCPGVTLVLRPGQALLRGAGVDEALQADLRAWLEQRGTS